METGNGKRKWLRTRNRRRGEGWAWAAWAWAWRGKERAREMKGLQTKREGASNKEAFFVVFVFLRSIRMSDTEGYSLGRESRAYRQRSKGASERVPFLFWNSLYSRVSSFRSGRKTGKCE